MNKTNQFFNNRRLCIILFGLIFSVFAGTAKAQYSGSPESGIREVALKTNLLYDAAMVPNIGVELALQEQWSLCANWFFAWWQNDSRHRFWHTYGGEIDVRKWLGKRAEKYPLQGHHLGMYLMGGTYDFEWGHKGYMCDFAFNVGLSYGYAVKIARNLSLDFVVGFGYLTGTYRKYQPQGDGYCILKTDNMNYFGPSKAEISLVWSISDLFKCKKGGRK